MKINSNLLRIIIFGLFVFYKNDIWAISNKFSKQELEIGITKVDTNLIKEYYKTIDTIDSKIKNIKSFTVRAQLISNEIKKLNNILLNQIKENDRLLLSTLNNSVKLNNLISNKIASEVLNSTISHSVVGEKSINKYDPKSKIGFCFGRATYIHWRLLELNISPLSLSKIFAIGKLYHTNQSWDYHVATMALKSDGERIVIDTLIGYPVSIDDWMNKVMSWDMDKKSPQLLFFVTSPLKFLPISGPYNKKELYLKDYNGYFKDLVKNLNPYKL